MNERTTTNGQPPAPGHEQLGAPQPVNPATGQHGAYWVLSEEERAKGFVRPVRDSYIHRGLRPQYQMRNLTPEERERFRPFNYVKYETYPEGGGAVGRYWTMAQLESGCGGYTRMSRDIAETYARNPRFYGSTFCCRCRVHLPIEEFTWVDVNGLHTTEVLGS